MGRGLVAAKQDEKRKKRKEAFQKPKGTGQAPIGVLLQKGVNHKKKSKKPQQARRREEWDGLSPWGGGVGTGGKKGRGEGLFGAKGQRRKNVGAKTKSEE